jgi:hypothetical protein
MSVGTLLVDRVTDTCIAFDVRPGPATMERPLKLARWRGKLAICRARVRPGNAGVARGRQAVPDSH